MNCRNTKEGSHELITQLPGGINIISREYPSSDIEVFYQIWKERQYQPVVDLINNTTGNKGFLRIIDAGGNIGCTGLYLKKQFPNSCILILEPEASNFALLEKNINLNKCQGTVLLNAGLWKNEAYLEVKKDFRDKKEWTYYVKEVPYPTKLKGFGVLDLMKKYKWEYIDLFKIDIEGGERYLFEDENQARCFLSKTKFIAIEIHDEFDIRNKIDNCLKDNGFDFFVNGELTIGKNKNFA